LRVGALLWRACLAQTPSALDPLTILPRAGILPGSTLRLLVALLSTLVSAMRSRRHLVIENLALGQQLATLAGRRHPDIRPADRVFWVLLHRSWSRWAEALAIVRPDTVVRLHRAGFRTYWNWLSRRGKRSGRPPLPREVRALIRRMASENPGARPVSTGNCFASASTSPSAASPDTCVLCHAHREPTPPGRPSSFGMTATGVLRAIDGGISYPIRAGSAEVPV
jgi:hypothetical protein